PTGLLLRMRSESVLVERVTGLNAGDTPSRCLLAAGHEAVAADRLDQHAPAFEIRLDEGAETGDVKRQEFLAERQQPLLDLRLLDPAQDFAIELVQDRARRPCRRQKPIPASQH